MLKKLIFDMYSHMGDINIDDQDQNSPNVLMCVDK